MIRNRSQKYYLFFAKSKAVKREAVSAHGNVGLRIDMLVRITPRSEAGRSFGKGEELSSRVLYLVVMLG